MQTQIHGVQATIIPSNGARLYTLIYPKANAETVILLHGGPGHPDEMQQLSGLLFSKFQVVVFHQRGTGKSPCTDDNYSLDSYMDDLDAVAGFVKAEKFHVLGHSWGAVYAMIYAEQQPHRLHSMFLSSAAPGTNKHWKEGDHDIMRYLISCAGLFRAVRLGFMGLFASMGNDPALRKFYSGCAHYYHKGFIPPGSSLMDIEHARAKAAFKTRKNVVKFPMLSRIPDHDFKISISYGDHDVFDKSGLRVRERYPGASFRIIPRSGHYPWLHNPEAFLNVLKEHFGHL